MTRTLCSLLLGFGLCLLTARSHADQPARVVVPGNGTEYDPHAKRYAEIVERLDRIEKRLIAGAPAARPGADRRVAQEQVMLRRCAGCHTPSRIEAGKDGGALILFNDDESKGLRLLGPREWADVADRIKRGDMPPKPRDPCPPKERELFE